MAHKWYAIQTYAGSEQAVKKAIINLVQDHGISEKLERIVVPTEDVIEVKNGKKKITTKVLDNLDDSVAYIGIGYSINKFFHKTSSYKHY